MTDIELQIQKEVIQILGTPVPKETSFAHFTKELENYINHLIEDDLQKLVALLYKIDINEKHLKKLLNDNKEKNTASIIAKLLIDRQSEKINTRHQFSFMPDSGEEKW